MLQQEIENTQRLVKTDAYQMSLGEVVNMYKDGELIINPDFQRLFRWEIGQKSKLIESLLLGIPIPSIFVFEKDDGKWELIDGLQRVSTILEFMGLLRTPGSERIEPPSYLVATKYLPSLNNAVWEKSDQIPELPRTSQSALDKSHKLAIRRARLGVEILKKPSDNKTKYDLFQRLNAGGTPANAQELRNCVIIMVSPHYFTFVKELAEQVSFQEVVSVSEEQREKQRHVEYATRFLAYNYVPYDGLLDVEEFIDDSIITLAGTGETAKAGARFKDTFELLFGAFGGNALRRFDGARHSGRVSLAAFECIAVGIGMNIDRIRLKPDPAAFVKERVESFWTAPEVDRFFAPGMRGTTRIQRTIPFGRGWFCA